MEADNFEEHVHRRFLSLRSDSRFLPQELRINYDNNISPPPPPYNNMPTFAIQFYLRTHEDFWYILPHHCPAQLQHMDGYHQIETKSLYLRLYPSDYMSYDMFNRVVSGNLKNWDDKFEDYYEELIHCLIRHVHKIVGQEGTTCQYLEMSVDLTLKIQYVWDGRLDEVEDVLSRFNMMIATRRRKSSSSIMLQLQLPERMDIDGDECLNDDCVICFDKLGMAGKKILCLPCSHMFHGVCITNWFNKKHTTCPICRYDVPTAR